jgi:hypothetical protein
VLADSLIYKTTRFTDLVVQRRVRLYGDRLQTQHDSGSGDAPEKTWQLDRACRLDPESADDIARATRTIRPPGTWTVTAAATAKGTPIDLVRRAGARPSARGRRGAAGGRARAGRPRAPGADQGRCAAAARGRRRQPPPTRRRRFFRHPAPQYCITIHWPASWLATKAYSSCGLCFPTHEEAAAWHSLITRQIGLLRLRGPSHSRSESLGAGASQHSRKASAEEFGAPPAPPSTSMPSLSGGALGGGLLPAVLRRRRGQTVRGRCAGGAGAWDGAACKPRLGGVMAAAAH